MGDIANLPAFFNDNSDSFYAKSLVDTPGFDDFFVRISRQKIGKPHLGAVFRKCFVAIWAYADQFSIVLFDGIIGLTEPASFKVSAGGKGLWKEIDDDVPLSPEV